MRLEALPNDRPICQRCLDYQTTLDAMSLWRNLGRIVAGLLLMLLLAGPALAQPSSLTISAPLLGASGVTFTVTWPEAGAFPWQAGYNDGPVVQQGTNASPLTLPMVYHADGAAAAGWICFTSACAPFTVPAKPVAPPVSTTLTVLDGEPGTNADGTPLTDLAVYKLYYRIDAGPELSVVFPASRPSGGQAVNHALVVPVVSGTITLASTAIDTSGNESVRSPTSTRTIGSTKPLPAGSGTLQLTR